MRAALVVFARHGLDRTVIDLIIREAGVSRGTFYNYFRTDDELFLAVAEEVSGEIIRIVDPLVRQNSDPAARVACRVSMVVRLARTHPIFAEFVVRGGPAAVTAGSLAAEVVPRDIRLGQASGQFTIADERLAFDLIVGPVIMAFQAVLDEVVSDSYPVELAKAVLRSLGVAKAAAARYASRQFGELTLSEDSIFLAGGPGASAG